MRLGARSRCVRRQLPGSPAVTAQFSLSMEDIDGFSEQLAVTPKLEEKLD